MEWNRQLKGSRHDVNAPEDVLRTFVAMEYLY